MSKRKVEEMWNYKNQNISHKIKNKDQERRDEEAVGEGKRRKDLRAVKWQGEKWNRF